MLKLFKLALIFLSLTSLSFNSSGAETVTVPDHTLPEGVVISGYNRPKIKTGFIWVPGKNSANETWIPGYWRPSGPSTSNKIWEAGRFHRGEWLPGRWINKPPNMTWIPGHYNRWGRWIKGQFR